jgi:general stress protein YciG
MTRGNPYLDDGHDPALDAPDAIKVSEALHELDMYIEGLPAGSLSGGMPVKDEYELPDPLGYYDHTPRRGLSEWEKDNLRKSMAARITGTSRMEWEALEDAQDARQMAAQDLWQEYQNRAPHLAADPAAVQATIERVNAQLRREGKEPSRYMSSNREQYLDQIVDEQAWPGSTLWHEVAATYQDAGRTGGISGGGGPGGSASNPDEYYIANPGRPGGRERWSKDRETGEYRPDDMIEDLRQQQRRSGLY